MILFYLIYRLIPSQTGTYILKLPSPTGTVSLCIPPTTVMGWWTTLYSIYSHQKSELFLLSNNRLTCLQWMSHLLYIFYLGAGRASSLITPTDKMQRDLWPWPRRLIASASAVPPSGNEAHSRNPIRSTQSSNHKCYYLQIDIAVQNPDILSVCRLLEMNQHLSSYYPPTPPSNTPSLGSLCPYCSLDRDKQITPLILFALSEDWENGSIIRLLAACFLAYVNFHSVSSFCACGPVT